jgi:hypothetical protein
MRQELNLPRPASLLHHASETFPLRSNAGCTVLRSADVQLAVQACGSTVLESCIAATLTLPVEHRINVVATTIRVVTSTPGQLTNACGQGTQNEFVGAQYCVVMLDWVLVFVSCLKSAFGYALRAAACAVPRLPTL